MASDSDVNEVYKFVVEMKSVVDIYVKHKVGDDGSIHVEEVGRVNDGVNVNGEDDYVVTDGDSVVNVEDDVNVKDNGVVNDEGAVNAEEDEHEDSDFSDDSDDSDFKANGISFGDSEDENALGSDDGFNKPKRVQRVKQTSRKQKNTPK